MSCPRCQHIDHYLALVISKPLEMHQVMRTHHLKLTSLDDPMHKLAFTFYTELCELAWRARILQERESDDAADDPT